MVKSRGKQVSVDWAAVGHRILTVKNISAAAVNITVPGISIIGGAASDYSQTGNCGSTIAAGNICTITLKFAPTIKGARSATLELNDNGGGRPQKVSLSGTGQWEILKSDPSERVFARHDEVSPEKS